MIKRLTSLFLIVSSLTAGEITIAVAANVSYAIDDLKAEFAKSHPDTQVRIILGSSGKLTAQIKNGAPYGLFMSANMAYPEALYRDKLALTQPTVYAEGTLACFSAKPTDFSEGITLLTHQTIKKIAIANPKTAPYGKAAVEALRHAGIYDTVKPKLIYAESISQTVAYSVTAADIGLIAASSLYSPNMRHYREAANWILVDPELYTPIKQGIVLLKKGADEKAYHDFYDFILSKDAGRIFKRYGYRVK